MNTFLVRKVPVSFVSRLSYQCEIVVSKQAGYSDHPKLQLIIYSEEEDRFMSSSLLSCGERFLDSVLLRSVRVLDIHRRWYDLDSTV